MIWLLLVIIAQLFYALVFIIDKYILSRPLPHPVVYAFYVGILSIVIWVLIPFGFYFPSFGEVVLALLAGAAQVIGWIFLYKALNKGEVSRVIPFVGGFIAVFILILSMFLIGEHLSGQQFLAFVLLVLGSLIISIKKKKFLKGFLEGAFGLALFSALLFAIFWVITKYIFLDTPFITGLVWIRTGAALFALTLLLPRKNRKLIFKKTEKLRPKTIRFFISARALGIVAGLSMYLAVFLGSVTLANSLQGLQYIFILILAFLLFRKIPNLREQLSGEIIAQKIIAIVLIGLGLAFLVL
jgi:drug/metabolite transporter (DMT)-like permease